jgi:hypothetical protein
MARRSRTTGDWLRSASVVICRLRTLKRFRDEVGEARDHIECFTIEEVKRTL